MEFITESHDTQCPVNREGSYQGETIYQITSNSVIHHSWHMSLNTGREQIKKLPWMCQRDINLSEMAYSSGEKVNLDEPERHKVKWPIPMIKRLTWIC